MKKIVIVSGGFDPLHSGHLEYFKYAKKLGDKLVVGINSDQWLTEKKGKNFLPFEERLALVEAIKDVDEVLAFNDEDGSAINLIKIVIKYKFISLLLSSESESIKLISSSVKLSSSTSLISSKLWDKEMVVK